MVNIPKDNVIQHIPPPSRNSVHECLAFLLNPLFAGEYLRCLTENVVGETLSTEASNDLTIPTTGVEDSEYDHSPQLGNADKICFPLPPYSHVPESMYLKLEDVSLIPWGVIPRSSWIIKQFLFFQDSATVPITLPYVLQ